MIGHRGASGYRPEHTRAAYELAFRQGAGAVEPDIVATKDGVLVLRHENEISGTTDVASRPEFAHLRATKLIDGIELTGWFTEDFTWPELETVRATERLPALRPASAAFGGRYGILRLRDLTRIIDEESEQCGRDLIMVAELKHATYFESIGLPLDELFASEIASWATTTNLITESFEVDALTKVAARAVPGARVFLLESSGWPVDLGSLPVDGVSFDKHMIMKPDAAGALHDTGLVSDAHAAGLTVYTWTLRAENEFLPASLRHGANPATFGDWRTEFAAILATGVDGVFADQPDLVLGLLTEAGGGSGPAQGRPTRGPDRPRVAGQP